MRQVREILRLKYGQGLPHRAIARACGVGVGTVSEYCRWQPGRTHHIPSWCGCTSEYVPVPVDAGWWQLVPIWEPDQTMNPLRQFAPPEPR
jgi:hypothetical protein